MRIKARRKNAAAEPAARLDLQWFAEGGAACPAQGEVGQAGKAGGLNAAGNPAGEHPAACKSEAGRPAPAAAGTDESGTETPPKAAPGAEKGAEGTPAAAVMPAEGPEKAPAADQRVERERRAIRSLCAAWLREGDELKRTYPGFDLGTELHSPDFVRLMKSGVSLRAAYQATHMDELLGGAMQYAADKAAAAAAARMAERARRPAENGARPQAGAVFHTDVAKLSRAQREEIERRAARGERILF